MISDWFKSRKALTKERDRATSSELTALIGRSFVLDEVKYLNKRVQALKIENARLRRDLYDARSQAIYEKTNPLRKPPRTMKDM